ATTFSSLTINNGAGVSLATGSIVNATLTLSDGPLDNSANNVTLSSGATISRATGSLAVAPTFAGTVNLIYTGSTPITTGPEIPTSATVLNNLTVNNTGSVTLSANVTVNGSLTIGAGATLDVSASNFSLDMKGNWTNNGGTFTPQ